VNLFNHSLIPFNRYFVFRRIVAIVELEFPLGLIKTKGVII